MRGLLATTGFVLFATTASAQGGPAPQVDPVVTNPPSTTGSTNLTNQANNPVTPLPELLVQNYLMPAPQGYDGWPADEQLLRFYWPFMVSGVQNIFRIYQPIFTKPLFPHGKNAGLGDTTVFDLALHKLGKFTLGGGPLLVIPSASYDNMGDGKWQAGVAGIVVTERSWGLLAAIVTYSHSFSGYGSGRPSTQVVGVQPLAHYNFNYRYYLRSSGIRNFDYGDHTSVIPIGFGAGKVTRLRSGIITNVYVEVGASSQDASSCFACSSSRLSVRCTTPVRDRRSGRSSPQLIFSLKIGPNRNSRKMPELWKPDQAYISEEFPKDTRNENKTPFPLEHHRSLEEQLFIALQLPAAWTPSRQRNSRC